MTVYILGAATLILVILIVWRRVSPGFKQRSEQPKYEFLSNLGVDAREERGPEQLPHERQRKD